MTRTFALAIAALMGTATLASANSTFGIIDRQGASSNIELGLVRSDAAGIVELYSGDSLVGSTSVREGANSDVQVNLGFRPLSDLTAVLRSGDDILATTRIDIDRNDS